MTSVLVGRLAVQERPAQDAGAKDRSRRPFPRTGRRDECICALAAMTPCPTSLADRSLSMVPDAGLSADDGVPAEARIPVRSTPVMGESVGAAVRPCVQPRLPRPADVVTRRRNPAARGGRGPCVT